MGLIGEVFNLDGEQTVFVDQRLLDIPEALLFGLSFGLHIIGPFGLGILEFSAFALQHCLSKILANLGLMKNSDYFVESTYFGEYLV